MNSYDFDQLCTEIKQNIHSLGEQKKIERRREKTLRGQEYALQYVLPGLDSSTLLSALSAMLPSKDVPRNVGPLEVVNWNQFYQFDFDFGVNPVLTGTTQATQFVEVTQEAAFLVTKISQNFEDSTANAGGRGPWQLQIRDNQSSRFLNDGPTPIQCFGSNSLPTKLSVPYLFQPKGTINVNVGTFLSPAETLNSVGSSKFSIAMWGIRVRVDDSQYPALDAFFRECD